MKKDKKSHRSKVEHRRHKALQSHSRKSTESREKHAKPHGSSKSPSTSKRKHEEEKERETPKATQEVRRAKVELAEVEPDFIVFENVLNDKEKLLQELFEAISGDNLTKITPDSLKNCSLDDIKSMCLEELNRMSKAEIVYVMSGKDPTSFDPSWNTEIEEEEKDKNVLHSSAAEGKEQPKEHVTEKCVDTSRSPHSETPKKLTESGRLSADDEHESTSSVTGDVKSEAESDSLELCATQKEIDSLIQEEILNQAGAQALAQQTKSDLTDMEILELELRARIIRSLLKNHGMEVSDEEIKIQQKENIGLKEGNT